jgi:MFS family permease
VLIGCALALTVLSATNAPLIFTFVTLAVIGTARAFNNPAEGTLTPLLVPESLYQSAATWSTAVWQLSAVTGPAVGGILIGLTGGAVSVYIANAFAGLVLVGALLIIRPRPQKPFESGESPLESVKAGLRFLRHNKVILPAITLDMFAVLLGGAIYLLPIYATDILLPAPDRMPAKHSESHSRRGALCWVCRLTRSETRPMPPGSRRIDQQARG